MKDYFLAAIEARDLLSEAVRKTRPDTPARYAALARVDPNVLIRLQTAALQHASEGNLAPAAAAAIEAVQSAVFGLKAVSVFARSASTLEWEAAENALNDAMLRLQPYVRLEQQPAAEPAAPAAAGGMLSVRELAEKHGVNGDALRKRLERWMLSHDGGYIEVSNRRPKEPKYVYDERAILPVIDALKTSMKRPAKKN